MEDVIFCSDCGILLPMNKLSHHRNSRTRICEYQQFFKEVKTKDIYLECACGSFIQQGNISNHCLSDKHRKFMEHYPQMVNHPMIQRLNSRTYIDGGRIYAVNTETLNLLEEGREFSLLFFQNFRERNNAIDNDAQLPLLEPLVSQVPLLDPLEVKEVESPHRLIPTFFMDFIRESSNKEIECIICYELITRDNIFILPCFHIICCKCQAKLKVKKCPTCRKRY